MDHLFVHEGEIRTFIIQYRGIPEAGLEIKNNRFGDRTFFSDSWPNNKYWLIYNL